MPIDISFGVGYRLGIFIIMSVAPLIELRDPLDVGGFTWLFLVIEGLISNCFMLFLALSNASASPDDGYTYSLPNQRLSNEIIWTCAIALMATSISSFAIFIAFVNPSKRHTFYRWQTPQAYNLEAFWVNVEDEYRWEAIDVHPDYQPPKEEMREWIHAHFLEWELAKPTWWLRHRDDVLKGLPKECTPTEEMFAEAASMLASVRESSQLSDYA